MDNIRNLIAKNLIKYRKASKLTQYELANKLGYSDKAISKWECGEAMPDISVLKKIADLYNVSVDALMSEQTDEVKTKHVSKFFSNKIMITVLSYVLVWFVATIFYVLFQLIWPNVDRFWLTFIYAIPVGFIVLIVFSAMWFKKFYTPLSIIGLTWTLPLALYFTFELKNLWLIFMIGIPFTILTVLWYVYIAIKRKQKLSK